MLPRQITHQNIFRVLIAGFSLVILLLVAAAIVGIRNIQSIRENAVSLVREQALSNRLIDELHSQQTTLSEVFSVLARDPDSVDYTKITSQLDEADRDIARISFEGERTAEYDLWQRLNRSSLDFSLEARRLLAIEDPETFSSIDLFRYHGSFASVVARLLEAEYRKLNTAQGQIEGLSSRLSQVSLVFAVSSVGLALFFAVFTVRIVSQLIRQMEWQTAELGRVSWQMLEDQEATARRFSHELHDELGQSLTAVKTNLSALASANVTGNPRLTDCLHLVDEAIGNVRQMSQLLRPTILDDFGLEASLRWLAEGFATRTGIEVQVESTYAGRLPDDTETHLFRIAQEALTNIARHAAATKVMLKLTGTPAEIRLSIQDDGRGLGPVPGTVPGAVPGTVPRPMPGQMPGPMPGTMSGAMSGAMPGATSPTALVSRTPSAPGKDDGGGLGATPPKGRGLGMIGMRARARSAGGDVNVRSRPGEGVLIEVRVPLRHEHEEDPDPVG